MSVIGALDRGEVLPAGLAEHRGQRVLLLRQRSRCVGDRGAASHRRGEVREVVLPLDAAVGTHARVQEHAALGGGARPPEAEGESAVDELVASRPVGRTGEERPGSGSVPRSGRSPV